MPKKKKNVNIQISLIELFINYYFFCLESAIEVLYKKFDEVKIILQFLCIVECLSDGIKLQTKKKHYYYLKYLDLKWNCLIYDFIKINIDLLCLYKHLIFLLIDTYTHVLRNMYMYI